MIWHRAKLGMAMLILSESVFFFMLILAFIYFRNESLATASASLRLGAATAYTLCLLMSGFTMWRKWLVPTILLGAVFFIGKGGEYLRLVRSGITIGNGLFGTTFFTLTGIHGLHVLLGLLLLGAAFWKKLSIQSVAMFWYFVASVWIAIFSVVYLWTFL
jgi:heme/copper-type cytochrome/quinol oxidase subunit 3